MNIKWEDSFMAGITYYSLFAGGRIIGEFWKENGVCHIKNDPRTPESEFEAKRIVVENYKKNLKEQLEALDALK